MSDFQKSLKAQATKPWVKKAEAGERAEGVRDALKAGKGNAVAGAKRLHMQKEGLPAAERMAEKRMKPHKKR
jgi:hypothetical protein